MTPGPPYTIANVCRTEAVSRVFLNHGLLLQSSYLYHFAMKCFIIVQFPLFQCLPSSLKERNKNKMFCSCFINNSGTNSYKIHLHHKYLLFFKLFTMKKLNAKVWIQRATVQSNWHDRLIVYDLCTLTACNTCARNDCWQYIKSCTSNCNVSESAVQLSAISKLLVIFLMTVYIFWI